MTDRKRRKPGFGVLDLLMVLVAIVVVILIFRYERINRQFQPEVEQARQQLIQQQRLAERYDSLMEKRKQQLETDQHRQRVLFSILGEARDLDDVPELDSENVIYKFSPGSMSQFEFLIHVPAGEHKLVATLEDTWAELSQTGTQNSVSSDEFVKTRDPNLDTFEFKLQGPAQYWVELGLSDYENQSRWMVQVTDRNNEKRLREFPLQKCNVVSRRVTNGNLDGYFRPNQVSGKNLYTYSKGGEVNWRSMILDCGLDVHLGKARKFGRLESKVWLESDAPYTVSPFDAMNMLLRDGVHFRKNDQGQYLLNLDSDSQRKKGQRNEEY